MSSPTESNKDAALAAEVAKRVQLHGIRLAQTQAVNIAKGNQLPQKMISTIAFRHRVNRKEGQIDIHCRFSVRMDYEESSSLGLKIEARYVLTYRAESLKDLTREHFESFAQMNGVLHAWPYWREYVQQMCNRMCLPTLIMPALRPLDVSRKQAKKNSGN